MYSNSNLEKVYFLYKAVDESIVDKQNEGFIIHSDLIETFNN